MPDNPTPSEPTVTPAPELGPTPDPNVTPVPEPADVWDYERGMTTIVKLRDEVKTLKSAAKDRDDLAARLKQLEDAQLSDAEKQAKRLADLETKEAAWAAERQELRLQAAVLAAAPGLGAADPEIALALLDRSKLEYDEQGDPANLPDVIGELLERKPLLRGTPVLAPPAPAGALNAGSGQAPPPAPQLTAQQLQWARDLGMTPQEYADSQNLKGIADYEKLREQRRPAPPAVPGDVPVTVGRT